MNAKVYDPSEERFDDYLDSVYGPVNVCGYTYVAFQVLKEVDPTAYDADYSEYCTDNQVYICGECGEEYDNEDDAEDCCQPEEMDDEEDYDEEDYDEDEDE